MEAAPACEEEDLACLEGIDMSRQQVQHQTLEELAYLRGEVASPVLGLAGDDTEQQLQEEDRVPLRTELEGRPSLYYQAEEQFWRTQRELVMDEAGIAAVASPEPTPLSRLPEPMAFESVISASARSTQIRSAAQDLRRVSPTEEAGSATTARMTGRPDTARAGGASKLFDAQHQSRRSSAAVSSTAGHSSTAATASELPRSSSCCSSVSGEESEPMVPLSSILLQAPGAPHPVVYVPYLPSPTRSQHKHHRRRTQKPTTLRAAPPPPARVGMAAEVLRRSRVESLESDATVDGEAEEEDRSFSSAVSPRSEEASVGGEEGASAGGQEQEGDNACLEQEQQQSSAAGLLPAGDVLSTMLLRSRSLLAYVQTLCCALDKVSQRLAAKPQQHTAALGSSLSPLAVATDEDGEGPASDVAAQPLALDSSTGPPRLATSTDAVSAAATAGAGLMGQVQQLQHYISATMDVASHAFPAALFSASSSSSVLDGVPLDGPTLLLMQSLKGLAREVSRLGSSCQACLDGSLEVLTSQARRERALRKAFRTQLGHLQDSHTRSMGEALDMERAAFADRARVWEGEVEEERRGWEAERGSLQEELTVLRAELGAVKRASEALEEEGRKETDYALYCQRVEMEKAVEQDKAVILEEVQRLRDERDEVLQRLSQRCREEVEACERAHGEEKRRLLGSHAKEIREKTAIWEADVRMWKERSEGLEAALAALKANSMQQLKELEARRSEEEARLKEVIRVMTKEHQAELVRVRSERELHVEALLEKVERQERAHREQQLAEYRAQVDAAQATRAAVESRMRREADEVLRQVRAAHEAEMRKNGREIMRLQRALDRSSTTAAARNALAASPRRSPLAQSGDSMADSGGGGLAQPTWLGAIEAEGSDLLGHSGGSRSQRSPRSSPPRRSPSPRRVTAQAADPSAQAQPPQQEGEEDETPRQKAPVPSTTFGSSSRMGLASPRPVVSSSPPASPGRSSSRRGRGGEDSLRSRLRELGLLDEYLSATQNSSSSKRT